MADNLDDANISPSSGGGSNNIPNSNPSGGSSSSIPPLQLEDGSINPERITWWRENILPDLLNIGNMNDIQYGSLDELGRPTRVTATLELPLGEGTSASVKIANWPSSPGNWPVANDRAHLLANMLGGEGNLWENIVPMNPFNNQVMMRSVENQVKNALDNGQTVVLSVTPIYQGNALRPSGITIQAMGSGTNPLDLHISIPNW